MFKALPLIILAGEILPSKGPRKNYGEGFDMLCDCDRRVKGEECKDDGKMSGVGGMYPALRDSVFRRTQL